MEKQNKKGVRLLYREIPFFTNLLYCGGQELSPAVYDNNKRTAANLSGS